MKGWNQRWLSPPKPARYMLLVFSVFQIPRALTRVTATHPTFANEKKYALTERVRQGSNWANSINSRFGLLFGLHWWCWIMDGWGQLWVGPNESESAKGEWSGYVDFGFTTNLIPYPCKKLEIRFDLAPQKLLWLLICLCLRVDTFIFL